MNPTPRKHAATIKAWADGHQIEVLDPNGWKPAPMPVWSDEHEYRVKPPVLVFALPIVIKGGQMHFYQPRTPEQASGEVLVGVYGKVFGELFGEIFKLGKMEGTRYDLYIEIDTDGMKLAKAELVEHKAPVVEQQVLGTEQTISVKA